MANKSKASIIVFDRATSLLQTNLLFTYEKVSKFINPASVAKKKKWHIDRSTADDFIGKRCFVKVIYHLERSYYQQAHRLHRLPKTQDFPTFLSHRKLVN